MRNYVFNKLGYANTCELMPILYGANTFILLLLETTAGYLRKT